MFGSIVGGAVDATLAPFMRTETFESRDGVTPAPARVALVSLLTFVIVLAALLLVGKFLWNNVLVQVTTIVKPIKSVWQLLGLAILISLIHPGCCY